MPTVNELIRRRLLRDVPERVPDLDVLLRTERSPLFERMRARRKVLGAMRYGRLGARGKPQFDRVADMIRRLNKYAADGNAEHLVDVANLAELEFVEGARCVRPTDDGAHTEEAA
jgi:2-keto-3-deoxy-L-rhamnonate aldolase RhmA